MVTSRLSRGALLIAALGCIHCSPKKDPPKDPVDPPAVVDTTTPDVPNVASDVPNEATDAGKILAQLDAKIAFNAKRIAKRDDDWLSRKAIATAYMQRARLTHDWKDWDEAQRHIDDAFKVAKKGSGPFITRANLNFSLHHFPEVEADLESASKKLLMQNAEQATVASRRAELALQRGDLERAEELMAKAYALHKDPAIRVQQGIFAFKMGELDEARQLIDEAIAGIDDKDTMTLGWATLQRGILELDSGHVQDANALFSKANTLFSGWYLIEEHLAETIALRGEHVEARAMYESIVARVPTGEFMEALADTCEALGDDACATAQRAQAKKTYLADMASHPQAAYGHGMDFFLQGEDGPKMIEIAQANYDLRPGYDAGTRLAQAHIRLGQFNKAQPLLDSALKAGWSTADLHATAATLYALQGDDAEAKAQRALAQKRHAKAMEDIAWLEPMKAAGGQKK